MTCCLPAEPAASTRRLVRGRLDAHFALSGEGQTFIARQYASYPFHICRAQYHDREQPGLATLYLQSCSGGLYEDDRLDITLIAAPKAEAHVTTQASTIVHSMPAGHATQDVRIEAQAGSYLEFLPDPQILFPGSRFTSNVVIRLAETATVLICDAFLTHNPPGSAGTFASFVSAIEIEDDAGRRLALDRIALDAEAIDLRSAGLLGRFGAQGTLLVATMSLNPDPLLEKLRASDPSGDETFLGMSILPKSAGLLIRILARDGAALRRAMHAGWSACRQALKGAIPAPRRK